MDVLFVLKPDYFNLGINNINVVSKFFVFNKRQEILNSNISDEKLMSQIPVGIQSKSMEYNNSSYKIRYLKLRSVDLFLGVVYEKYAFVSMILNIVKIIIFIAVLYFIFIGVKILINKIKDINAKEKTTDLEMVTGAMMEVAKNIKSAAEVHLNTEPQVNIDKKDMEEAVNNVMSKYIPKERRIVEETDNSLIKKEASKNIKSKDVNGWKLIEY